ncbi:MAG: hypothetical protein HC800_10550 [Phormidesmis sp. RL_2_1]|nr:hypothetical protein [Phormidesmis sp. RL_2_1]
MVALAINFRILRYGIVFESYDLHAHIKWLQHFSYQLAEGSWYPRWLAGLNHGYGSPTFVFYPPAVVYLGSALKAIGLNAERAMAALMVLMSCAAGLGFYRFGRVRWHAMPALFGAMAYMSAPYIVYNTYHRGALAEVLATSILPFGLAFTDELIDRNRRWLALTVCFSLLSLTHLPSLLIYVIAWSLYILAQRLSFKRLFYLATAPVMGFGLSSIYLIPAVLEKKLVNLDSMREVAGGFGAHLVPLIGNNVHKLEGNIITIFRYGVVSTVIFLTIAVATGFSRSSFSNSSHRVSRSQLVWIRRGILWLISLGVVSFLMSPAAYLIWAASPTLQMIQFPWRLMGLFSLIYAGAFGFALEVLLLAGHREGLRQQPIWQRLLAAGLLVALLGWNIRYSHDLTTRHPGFYQPGDLTEARAAGLWQAKSFDTISIALNDPYTNRLGDVAEYLPLLPDTQSVVPRPQQNQTRVRVVSGQASVVVEQWKSEYRRLSVNVDEQSEIHVRTYNYPAWHAYIDGEATPIQTTSDGLIGLTLAPGAYTVELRYQATPAMKLGGLCSGVSLMILGVLGFRKANLRSLKQSGLKQT